MASPIVLPDWKHSLAAGRGDSEVALGTDGAESVRSDPHRPVMDLSH